MNVKRKCRIVVALTISVAGCAQNGPPVSDARSTDQQHGDLSPLRREDAGPIWRNANDCAPDLPVAVWGPGNKLVGYSCIRTQRGFPVAAGVASYLSK
jgi:hypothetical protein